MELKTPTLIELASAIAAQTAIVNSFLEKNQHPQPSFASCGLRGWNFPDLELQQARTQLIEAATDILYLAQGPSEYLKYQSLTLKFDLFVIGALNEWNVFEAVPLTGSISYSELAKKVNILESRLKRVIRHALNNHVFWAPTRDTIAHTSTSAEVVRDPLLFAWLGHNFDQVTPGTLKVLDSMKECKESEDLMQTGVSMAFGLKEDLYSWMSKDGEGEPGKDVLEGKVDNRDRAVGWRERRFGNAIKCVTAGGRHAAHHVNRGFDWGSLGKGTVVDCGGSIGHVSLEIAKANPNLTLIVQDFAALKPQFDITIPSDFKNRISFQAHDFFTLQPIKGASVYFFKHILHNWLDGKCIEILRNVVPVMEKGSKIVIMDGIMPEIGEVGNGIDRIMASVDLQMMVELNAKERTKGDWERLMASADKRLRVKAFRLPPGSAATLIEVVLESGSTKI